MKMTKFLKNKRGMALESAILFMIIIFMFCSLIMTMTLIGHHQLKIENTAILRDAALDQIGEDFVADQLAEDYENYRYKVSDDGSTLTVWRENDGTKTVLLYVEVERTDGVISGISSWRYSAPKAE